MKHCPEISTRNSQLQVELAHTCIEDHGSCLEACRAWVPTMSFGKLVRHLWLPFNFSIQLSFLLWIWTAFAFSDTVGWYLYLQITFFTVILSIGIYRHELIMSYLWLRPKKWQEISEAFSESFSNFLYIFSFLTVFSVCGSWHKGQSTAVLAAFPGGTASSSLSCHFTLGVSYSVDYLARSLSLFQHHCFQGTFSITYLWLYFFLHLMLWFCYFFIPSSSLLCVPWS